MQRRRCRAGHEGSAPRAPALLFLAAGALLLMQLRGAAASELYRCKTTVAAGSLHTCAILNDTTVKCWGGNGDGQLGYGHTNDLGDESDPSEMGANLLAVQLGANRTALSLSAGDKHTCALLDDASVKCWGRNDGGQLGYDDKSNRGDNGGEMGDSLPAVNLGFGRTALSITTGFAFTCALLDDLTIKCWGENDNGQLGYGDTSKRGDGSFGYEMASLPAVALGSGKTAVSVSAGAYHTCAILDDVTVKCWGWNSEGQLGYGDTTDRGGGDADGGDNTCGPWGDSPCDNNGGDNTCGPLGDQPCGRRRRDMGEDLAAVDLGTGRTAVSISAGNEHTCALLDDATIKCWGLNMNGQLGYDDTAKRGAETNMWTGSDMGDKLDPVALGTDRKALSISSGHSHNCALLDDATIKCWGYNNHGQLGYGHTSNIGDGIDSTGGSGDEMGKDLAAVDLGAGRTALSVFAGQSHVCAMLDDLTVKCWGWNMFGQLGYNDKSKRGDESDEMGAKLAAVDLGPVTVAPSGPVECAACPAGSYGYASNATMNATTCTPCPAGRYAASSGLAECTPCPAGSYSGAVGASASTTCISCPAGTSWSALHGSSNSTACTPCLAGSYADEGTCTSCPEFSSSLASSDDAADCECNPGYVDSENASSIENACVANETDTTPATPPATTPASQPATPAKTPAAAPTPTPATTPASQPATVTLAFTASVEMSVAEFDAVRGDYIAGVAVALGRAEADVRIVSVVSVAGRRLLSESGDHFTGRKLLSGRVLLSESALVKTAVTVPADEADSAASSLTAEKLNSALASRGISVGEVTEVSVSSAGGASTIYPSSSSTTEASINPAQMIVGIVLGILAAGVLVFVFVWWYRKYRANAEGAGDTSFATSDLITAPDVEISVDQGSKEPPSGSKGAEVSGRGETVMDGPAISKSTPEDLSPTPTTNLQWNPPQTGSAMDLTSNYPGTLLQNPPPAFGTFIQNPPSAPLPPASPSFPTPEQFPTPEPTEPLTPPEPLTSPERFTTAAELVSGWVASPGPYPGEPSPSALARPPMPPHLQETEFSGEIGEEPTSKFVARALVLGESAQAAEGLKEMLGLGNNTVLANLLRQSTDAIEAEFLTHGDKNDQENLTYCLSGIAQDPRWLPSQVKEDIEKGIYHGGSLQAGDYDEGHAGMTLDDFVEHDCSKLGKLGRAHVLALRLYTTSSFTLFNNPLRRRQKPHPFRMTVYYLDEALRKLRAVRASMDAKVFAGKTLLWRGMKDMVLSDPQKFKEQGGTEVAPMSTTENKEVALQYSNSVCPLLFKFKAKGLSMGVDISYLSVYPKEREVLYPPLTYLMPSGETEMEGNITVYTVKLTIS